jgi:iron(III) transport system ATP-binding protein
MIAGFNTIEGGDFYFDDKRINDIDPSKRNIGMVFQNYAIFPHLSVRSNVAFGLKNREYPRDQIGGETEEFLRLVKIEEYADRMPDKLSGGQQQRVALARALVIQPEVLLMDEPLSNLDAKLRIEMRTVIRDIQRNVGITTVYVTHDQEEAMAISDRIAVMNGGEIQHIGIPQAIYQRPANLFVATFIGKSNLFKANLRRAGKKWIIQFGNQYEIVMDNIDPTVAQEEEVLVSVRPEELMVIQSQKDRDGLSAVVDDSVFLGLNTHYYVTLETGEKAEIIQESQIGSIFPPLSRIHLAVKIEKINVFSSKTERSLMIGVTNQLSEAGNQ